MNKIKTFIDSDIILDVLLEREEFYENSAKLLNLGEIKKIELFTSATSITNIYYLLKKELNSSKRAIECIKDLMDIVKVLLVSEEIIKLAMKTEFSDFEDSIQYITAKINSLNYLITRNKKDYKKAEIEILNTEDFFKKFKIV